ncbi:TRAP transporter substrate-binding protein DctP [Campylobacter sp. faydin G-24]|uniref:TRAP transporter substrate-binding protein DctP n=1 Tax=Campylobacter anatolicus TaxID=2829105 RepID=A0ABS5HK99_9BACT|nr:TRAP transporter substrate-binding protein DctP [Campylobacter anatolicus]MBR8464700.1 TRAP transporter substrate-binding protein DctP [Campylobacter anatolicus]MBR8466466.1 TRAP transporter substrate-binding protein DctP [Campylobacter anatolicus]
MKKFAVFALSILLAISAIAAEKYKLKLATTYDVSMPVLGKAPKLFKDLVENMSNGRVEVRIDYPAKHKAQFAIFDMVKSGQYDVGYTAGYFYKGKDAKLMLFTTVPFGMNTAEQNAWFEYGGGKELSKKVFDQYNIVSFRGGNAGMQMGGWFKKEIKTLDDLKGLKIRIPGLGGEIMAKLGANINTIPIGELYMALEMGTIDAVEWVNPAADINFGFEKVAKYYYTGWQEPSSENNFYLNKKLFDGMPKDIQTIIQAAAMVVADDVYNEFYAKNAQNLDKISKEHPDVKIATFPPEILTALKNATNEVLDELSSKDPIFKEILTSQREFLRISREWTQTADFAYIKGNIEQK